MAGLSDAATGADELHRALVLFPPAFEEREPTVAISLFRRIHGRDASGATVTAMLLMTDSRWSVAARPVAARLEATGLVHDDGARSARPGPRRRRRCRVLDVPDGLARRPEIVIATDQETTNPRTTSQVTTGMPSSAAA